MRRKFAFAQRVRWFFEMIRSSRFCSLARAWMAARDVGVHARAGRRRTGDGEGSAHELLVGRGRYLRDFFIDSGVSAQGALVLVFVAWARRDRSIGGQST